MAVRKCTLVAIEGAHGTGKSTLVHALTAHFKSRHVHAASLAERARESPFVEEVVIHGCGEFDIAAELHLLASQVAQEQLLGRYHELVLCDKTVANVLGYSQILLGECSDPFTREMLSCIDIFCKSYAKQYDAVFYVSDFYDLSATRDPFRPTDRDFQVRANDSIREACKNMGLPIVDLPTGLTLIEKVAWIAQRIHLHYV